MCKWESASCCLPFPLFVQFSFSPIKFSVTDFSASMRARVFKFLIHLESGQVYCGTENQDAEIYFYHLFPFSFSSICHSNVIHREICTGTTAPRILKFGTYVGYDLLHCVKENQPSAAYHYLYLSIFLSLKFSVTHFSASVRASLQSLYTLWVWSSIFWERKSRCWD